MNNRVFQIISSSTSLRKCETKKTLIDSQLLYGETFNVEYYNQDLAYGIHVYDNYKGWVEKKDLGFFPVYNHLVSTPRSIITTKPDVKSNFIQYLPLASRIFVQEIENGWAKIRLSDRHLTKYGFLPSNHIKKKDLFFKDWVKISESLLKTPYRWGGRDSLGIDCSALVQLSMMFGGINVPRDTKDQFNFFKKSNLFSIYSYKTLKSFSRGDLIYWDGHIGILINDKEIIHSSASYGFVIIENIKNLIKKIGKDCRIIKYCQI